MRIALITCVAVVAMAASVLFASSVQRETARDHASETRLTENLLTDIYRSEGALESYALTGARETLVDRERSVDRLNEGLPAAAGAVDEDASKRALVAQQRQLLDRLAAIEQEAMSEPSEPARRRALRAESDRRHALVDRITDVNNELRTRQATVYEREDRRASLVAPLLIVALGLLFGAAGFVALRRSRRRAGEELRRRAVQERFGEAMQVAEDQAEAHGLLKSHLERSIGCASVAVLNRNNSADRLEATTPVADGSPLAERLREARPRSCMAVRLSRPFEQGESSEEVLACQVCGALGSNTTCQPLLVGGEVIGSVLTEHVDRLDPDQRERIAQSVAQSAPVLANLRNLAIAETRAATDALTGLPNRRAVDDTLLRMLAQAGRSFEPLSIVLLDLDHFKVVNDTYGHDRGDEVLAGVAARLREVVRESDFAGRSGGEEFVLFLAGTDRTGAVRVAEKVREAMRTLRVSGVDRELTASFGVGCFPDDAVDAAALMRSADRALYAAKRGGRDRIESSSSGTDQPVLQG